MFALVEHGREPCLKTSVNPAAATRSAAELALDEGLALVEATRDVLEDQGVGASLWFETPPLDEAGAPGFGAHGKAAEADFDPRRSVISAM